MASRFREFAEAYRDRVYTFALYSLRRREDAEDVTQEVLIKLWQNSESIDPERAGAWIMRVARNAVIDAGRRRRARLSVIAEDVDAEVTANYVVTAPDTEARVESREFRESLEEALAGVGEPHRSIVVMREIEEMTYAEIADAMDMPLNTVKVYLHRARRMLREALRERYRRDAV